MKGLSLTQPWASLMALNAKRIETRSWSTSYRGEVVIQAAQGFPGWARDLCNARLVQGAGIDADWRRLPRGVIVAVGRLVDVQPVERLVSRLTPQEEAFGNYDDGRFGWIFEDVRQVRENIPCKGALGLWSVPQIVLDLIAGQGVL